MSKPRWKWSTPQLNTKKTLEEKKYDMNRRRSSEWTKLRNTLEFIQKSRECLNFSMEEMECCRDLRFCKLIFLGQIYDVDIIDDQSSDEESNEEKKFSE